MSIADQLLADADTHLQTLEGWKTELALLEGHTNVRILTEPDWAEILRTRPTMPPIIEEISFKTVSSVVFSILGYRCVARLILFVSKVQQAED